MALGSKSSLSWLLYYQLAAMCVWVFWMHFWLIMCFTAMLLSSRVSHFFSVYGFFQLFSCVLVFAVAQIMLVASRLKATVVSSTGKSSAVKVINALVLQLHIHLAHGFIGAVLSHTFLLLLAWKDFKHLGQAASQELAYTTNGGYFINVDGYFFIVLSGFISGALYSFNFVFSGAGKISFPSLQMKRFARIRLALPGIIVRTFVFSSLITACAFGLVAAEALPLSFLTNMLTTVVAPKQDLAITSMVPTSVGVVNALFVVWLVNLSMTVSTSLYEVFMTERRPLSECTPLPISSKEEIELLLKLASMTEHFSIEEALHSYTLPDIAMQEKLQPNTVNNSALLRFAKGEKGESELNNWWNLVVRSTTSSAVAPVWMQYCTLRQKRLTAVTQALYASDAKTPGKAFRSRQPMSTALQLVHSKAYLDLSCLDSSRRRAIFSKVKANRSAWIDVCNSCSIRIDALTLLLKVSTSMCAVEPTTPVDDNGVALSEAFVLGPTPGEAKNMSRTQKSALGWQVEESARKWRKRSFFSFGWWYELLLKEFGAFDPITLQRQLFQEKSEAMSSKADAPAWERQWQHREKIKSRQWLSFSFLKRTPLQCTNSLFSNATTVVWAIRTLSLMTHHSNKEDKFGVAQPTIPLVICTLLDCVQAIDNYKASPAFYGSSDALPELEGNKLTRQVVDTVLSEAEMALYRITLQMKQAVFAFSYSSQQKQLLTDFVQLKR